MFRPTLLKMILQTFMVLLQLLQVLQLQVKVCSSPCSNLSSRYRPALVHVLTSAPCIGLLLSLQELQLKVQACSSPCSNFSSSYMPTLVSLENLASGIDLLKPLQELQLQVQGPLGTTASEKYLLQSLKGPLLKTLKYFCSKQYSTMNLMKILR